ncbi:MAG: ABC transporter ATP-binding protein [Saccharospirillum sp.]|nr:ABC transporter ATP-binding protein [Saccharospirillum sp.]
MIRLENVSKYYPTPKGRKYVLKDVNLEIPSGKNVAILGINGSGKSTLLRLLGGIDSPNSGRIRIDMDISWPMGLAGGLQGSMTGRDNAKFVCRIFGDSWEEMQARVKSIEDFADLGQYFDMPVKTYSSGMKSKIKLAISVAFDFDCYLFDELGSVGDALFRKKTESVFANKEGKANFIIVSHNINELIHDCDMAIVLHKGVLKSFESIMDGVNYYYEVTGAPVKQSILKKLEEKHP